MSMFINRSEEMKKLQEIFKSKKAELLLMYGRRRVGKSRLIVEAIKNTNSVYFLADASDNILEILSQQLTEEFVKFSNWEDFFEFVLKSKYEIFIIDEFQYLYQVNKAWPTILQRWWEKIKTTKKKIILCGSILSTVYKIAMGYGSALYGRKTFEMEIIPLKFKDACGFLKNYKIEDMVKAYCILGGVPRYLEEFDMSMSFEGNISLKILEKTSYLYNEPINLLFEEFRDSSTYLSVLLAISEGRDRFNEIAEYSKVGTNKLPKYLMTLERVGIIRKEISITEKKLKSKLTKYFIKDNFYKFWLNFVFKNKAQIEQGLKEGVFKEINKKLPDYFGKAFEEVCKELILGNAKGITKIGKWWYRDKEIDIVALNENEKILLAGECKWKSDVDAQKLIADLKEKTREIKWYNKERKEHFFLFAKSFKDKPKINDVTLVDLKNIEKYIKE